MRLPAPTERPTEYVVVLLGAVIAVLRRLVSVDEGLEADLTNLVVLAVPLVTWVVARRRGPAS